MTNNVPDIKRMTWCYDVSLSDKYQFNLTVGFWISDPVVKINMQTVSILPVSNFIFLHMFQEFLRFWDFRIVKVEVQTSTGTFLC